ncbi:uncharacterized protein LOC120331651 isoform X1 [Styela clava]
MGRRRAGYHLTRNLLLTIIICMILQCLIDNEQTFVLAGKTATRTGLVASTSKVGGSSSDSTDFQNSGSVRTTLFPTGNRSGSSPVERLRYHLMNKYDKTLPPVLDYRKSVEVKVDMTYRQVLDLDEKNQVLKSLIWYRQYWRDEHITWKPEDYDGVDELWIPSSSVWRPDIAVYEEVGARDLSPRLPFIKLTSEGDIEYAEPSILETSCSVDTAFFPFDSQLCSMTFVSWTQPVTRIDLSAKRDSGLIDLDSPLYFIDSGEWVLQKFGVRKQISIYNLDGLSNTSSDNEVVTKQQNNAFSSGIYSRKIDIPSTERATASYVKRNLTSQMYSEIRYSIIIRRNSSLYMQSMLFPSILLTSVALLGFYLPPDSGERVGLQITILLTFMVFLLTVGEMFPASTGPYLGIYFVLSMAQLGINIFMTVVVLHLHFKPCLQNKSSWKTDHKVTSCMSSVGSTREPDSAIPISLRRFLQFCNKYFAIADDGVAWMLPITKSRTRLPSDRYQIKREADERAQILKKEKQHNRTKDKQEEEMNIQKNGSKAKRYREIESQEKQSTKGDNLAMVDENPQCKVKILQPKKSPPSDSSKNEENVSQREQENPETDIEEETDALESKNMGRKAELQSMIDNFRLDVQDIVQVNFDKKFNEKDTDEILEEKREKEQEEWKSVARAVDRLFFRLYLFMMFSSHVILGGIALHANFTGEWEL